MLFSLQAFHNLSASKSVQNGFVRIRTDGLFLLLCYAVCLFYECFCATCRLLFVSKTVLLRTSQLLAYRHSPLGSFLWWVLGGRWPSVMSWTIQKGDSLSVSRPKEGNCDVHQNIRYNETGDEDQAWRQMFCVRHLPWKPEIKNKLQLTWS